MPTNRYNSFAVAVPTYRRPELLRRALMSLISQTHNDWVATVFDDSATNEGASVVADLGDSRITYRSNTKRAGAAFNIDRSFGARLGDTGDFGYVLEDDNYLLPRFLEHAATEMVRCNSKIGLFNQRIHDEGTGLMPLPYTTRGAWFNSGWITPLELHSSLLLMEGLSNGGIVWRLNDGVRLQVGECVNYSSLHEACRSLLVSQPIWYCEKAYAVWTRNHPYATARSVEKNRIVSRGRQSIVKKVIELHGGSAISRALQWSTTIGRRQQLVNALMHSGFWSIAWRIDKRLCFKGCKCALKGIVLKTVTLDPCRDFIRGLN